MIIILNLIFWWSDVTDASPILVGRQAEVSNSDNLLNSTTPQNDNSTSPSLVGWTQGPRTRGTADILISCLFTFTICVYTALHLDIPSKDTKYGKILGRKFLWILAGIFAPEYVVFAAWRQRRDARAFTKFMKSMLEAARSEQERKDKTGISVWEDHGFSIQEYTEWTDTHSFFLGMDGFCFAKNGPDTKHFPITFAGASLLFLCGRLPIYEKSEIMDRSRSDLLGKAVVCLQGSWLIIQSVIRLSLKLPITPLELSTLAHVICAMLVYWLWWDKPQDTATPILLKGDWADDLLMFFRVVTSRGELLSHIYKPRAMPEVQSSSSESNYLIKYLDFAENGRSQSISPDITPALKCLDAIFDLYQEPFTRNSPAERRKGNVFSKDDRFCSLEDVYVLSTQHLKLCASGKHYLVNARTRWLDAMRHLLSKDPRLEEFECACNSFEKTGLYHRDWVTLALPIARDFDGETYHKQLIESIERYKFLLTIWEAAHPCSHKLESILVKESRLKKGIFKNIFHLLNSKWKHGFTLSNPTSKFLAQNPIKDGTLKNNPFYVAIGVFGLGSMLYAAIHLGFWNHPFPSLLEQQFWRFGAILIAAGPITFYASFILIMIVSEDFKFLRLRKWLKKWFEESMIKKTISIIITIIAIGAISLGVLVWGLLALTYVIARVYIIIEAFICLRALPIEAYIIPRWSNFLPHV